MEYRRQPLSSDQISRYTETQPSYFVEYEPHWPCRCWGEPHGNRADTPTYVWHRCLKHSRVQIGME